MFLIIFISLIIIWILSYWFVINSLDISQYVIVKSNLDSSFLIINKSFLKKYYKIKSDDISLEYIEINFYSFMYYIMNWDDDLEEYFYKHCAFLK